MNRKGQTLAATLMVIAIIGILAVVMYVGVDALGGQPKPSPRADKLGNSTLSLSKLKAVDDVCMSNLRQVRMAVQMTRQTEDQLPMSLNDLPSVRSLASCPIGHEPFNYNPATGEVTCPHPGHEKY